MVWAVGGGHCRGVFVWSARCLIVERCGVGMEHGEGSSTYSLDRLGRRRRGPVLETHSFLETRHLEEMGERRR